MNHWSAIGRLTRDCETKFLPDGTSVVSFDLAVDTGTRAKPATLFMSCSAFGKTGDIIAQYAGRKGNQLAVEARLRQENWDDKTTGAKRSKISCVVERITLIGSRDGGGGGGGSDQSPPAYSGEESQAPVHRDGFAAGAPGVDADDSIPF